jgi:hypothetical protein
MVFDHIIFRIVGYTDKKMSTLLSLKSCSIKVLYLEWEYAFLHVKRGSIQRNGTSFCSETFSFIGFRGILKGFALCSF